MGFEYGKHKKEGGDSMWTSYSDLFLGLSIIFLLLYVSASLKQGTDGIKQSLEFKRVQKENEDLRQQIKAYETLKQDYMNRQASAEEQENYSELMDKLSLLQDEARDEKTKLREAANENEKKEKALNQYQQMIRNIINSNAIAKARIKSRNGLLDAQDHVIEEKTGQISTLEKDVAAKSQAITAAESREKALSASLAKRMEQLRGAYKAQHISRKKFEQERLQLQTEMDGRLARVRQETADARAEYDRASAQLAQTSQALAQTQGQLENAKGSLVALGTVNSRLKGELGAAEQKRAAEVAALKGQFEAQVAGMRGQFAAQAAAERAAFEGALARERLSGEEKAGRERAFAAAAAGKARALEDKIGAMGRELAGAQGQLASTQGRLAGTQAALNGTQAELAGTRGELARAQENLNAKKNLAAQIAKNFAANGVKAEVDGRNGDVMLAFGDQYFDTGRADLKPKMRTILEKAVPAYSASLFQDPKVASKIQSVEIVGFASPTYKGKFINPKSLDPGDRQAVNFNLDLSYKRAKSIFEYVFDKHKMSFAHQQQLLPLVKVTGRSFLSDADERTPAAAGTAEDFCRKNDCAKLQRVIIKFTLKD